MNVARFSELSDRSRIIAAVAVLLVLILAAILGFRSCGSSTPPVDAQQDEEQVVLDASPTALSWTTFQGVATPVAEEGPRDRTEPAPSGYERSPVGAALAAINATIRMSIATDSQWSAVSTRLIAPGEGRDWFIANRIQVSTTAAVPADEAPVILGYQVTNYESSSATVDIYSRYSDDSLTVNHTSVVWTAAEDWALVLPVPSSQKAPVTAVDEVPAAAVTLDR